MVRNNYATGDVSVAIDGAQVQNKGTVHFPMAEFIHGEGLVLIERTGNSWQGIYRATDSQSRIIIHSSPGLGDVVAMLRNGRRLRVESKKGKLQRSGSSQEYPLLREAIGQLMTVAEVTDFDLLGVAIPHSPKFMELCDRWADAPLMRRVGIKLIRIHRNGDVDGLTDV